MNISATKRIQRLARKERIRKNITGTAERPRLSIFKSAKYIYAQVIDDVAQKTLAAASYKEKTFKGKLKSLRNCDASKEIGKTLAERAKAKKIVGVVFDRSGFSYHGRVKALAEGAREGGLKF